MDEFVIYLNKFTKYTQVIFFLMGITYLFLGVSSILRSEILMGIIQLALASITIVLLILNMSKDISSKLYLKLDASCFYYRDSILFKPKQFPWSVLSNVEITKGKVYFDFKDGRKDQITLSALNFNEQQFLKMKLKEFKKLI
jgi:hypothetical protein